MLEAWREGQEIGGAEGSQERGEEGRWKLDILDPREEVY